MESRFEEMGSYFDARIEKYERHMLGMFKDFELFYETVASPIDETDKKIHILDLGCGTGAELYKIFRRVPNANITGIDMSEQMLGKLAEKFDQYKEQLNLIQGSYLTLPFEEQHFDYAVSVYTMHHFIEETKLQLYKKIFSSLKPGGKYIEGDCVVTPEKEQEIWEWYSEHYAEEKIRDALDTENMLYHIDIPRTVETQLHLLREAGFSEVDLIWSEEDGEQAIFVAEV